MAGKAGASGGARRNSGPKSNEELKVIRALIDSAITPARWKKLFVRMGDLAEKSRNDRAAILAMDLLCRYRYGTPPQIQILIGDSDAPPIQIIEIAPRQLTAPKAKGLNAGD